MIGPIQFRNLIAQLKPTEIKSFINNVNPEILIDALSSYFIHGARDRNKEVINATISAGIMSRQSLNRGITDRLILCCFNCMHYQMVSSVLVDLISTKSRMHDYPLRIGISI